MTLQGADKSKKPKCKDCKYWCGFWMPEIGDEGYSKHQIQTGECRRKSPPYIRAYEFMADTEASGSCSNIEALYKEGVWPFTLEYDWCGEFESKD